MSDEEEKEKASQADDPGADQEGTQGQTESDGVSKNFMEIEDDPLERAQKEGGEEAEFDLEAQIAEFYQQIEEDPDNCVHYYNLGEALEETGDHQGAQVNYERALALDTEGDFHAIIHFGLGNMFFGQLLSGIQSVVVKSSVGLHSAHKPGDQITEVQGEDYEVPIGHFEKALEHLPHLKADDDLVDFISKNSPVLMASVYYKWGSDLIDKSRQIVHYGKEKEDVQHALKLLKKCLKIDPNHGQAGLMIGYAKKMLQEGWKAYDEYGFEAKNIEGDG